MRAAYRKCETISHQINPTAVKQTSTWCLDQLINSFTERDKQKGEEKKGFSNKMKIVKKICEYGKNERSKSASAPRIQMIDSLSPFHELRKKIIVIFLQRFVNFDMIFFFCYSNWHRRSTSGKNIRFLILFFRSELKSAFCIRTEYFVLLDAFLLPGAAAITKETRTRRRGIKTSM